MIGKKKSDAWTRHHANAARTAFLGAYPEQAKLFRPGTVDSPMCVLCGKEEGTLRHLYWRCQADECRAAREPLVDPTRKNTFRELAHAGATAHTQELLWTRGLTANIAATPTLAIPDDDDVRYTDLATADPYFTVSAPRTGRISRMPAASWGMEDGQRPAERAP